MAKISTRITLRELQRNEIARIFPLVHAHNPSVTKAVFARRLRRMMAGGYRALGVFQGDTMIGCSGFWLRTRFWCGAELDIDNFIVSAEYRGKKIGQKMLAWLEKMALAEGCELLVLDAYADAFLAHRFYIREGFSLTGHHLTKLPGSRVPFQKKR